MTPRLLDPKILFGSKDMLGNTFLSPKSGIETSLGSGRISSSSELASPDPKIIVVILLFTADLVINL